MALTREEILAKRSVRPRKRLEVEGLGEVFLAKFSAKQRDQWEKIVTGGKPGYVNLDNVRARFVEMVLVNEDGTRLFKDGDADAIGELDSDIVQQIVNEGLRFNGLAGDAVEAAAGE